MDIFSLLDTWKEVGIIALTTHTVLKAVSDVTKTKKDDKFVNKAGSFIGYFFGARPHPTRKKIRKLP